jgi:hypothetical protein
LTLAAVLLFATATFGFGVPILTWARGARPVIGWTVTWSVLLICWISMSLIISIVLGESVATGVVVSTASTGAIAAGTVTLGRQYVRAHQDRRKKHRGQHPSKGW